jgi:sulfatase modifying factor 1
MNIGITQTPKLAKANTKLSAAFQVQEFSTTVIDLNTTEWINELETFDVLIVLLNEQSMASFPRENWRKLLSLKQKETLEIIPIQIGHSAWNYSAYADQLTTFPLDKTLLSDGNLEQTVTDIIKYINGNLVINEEKTVNHKPKSSLTNSTPSFSDKNRAEQRITDIKNNISIAKIEKKWFVALELYEDLIALTTNSEKEKYQAELEQLNAQYVSNDLIKKGKRLFSNGNFEAALSIFEEAYKIRPSKKSHQSILKIKSKIRHQKVAQKEQKNKRTNLYIVLATLILAAIIAGLVYYSNIPEPINTEIEVVEAEVPDYEMVLVEGGTFSMGKKGEADQEPVHKVKLTSFYMGKYEITVEQFDLYCKSQNIDFYNVPFGRGKRPMTKVSWVNALEYANWLSKQDGYSAVYLIRNEFEVIIDKKANGYRLPTECQWEFAARGGNNSQRKLYSGSNSVHRISWYSENAGNKSRAVGTKLPNELGIHDMSGNVWEWCWDWYGERSYGYHEKTNPQGMKNGTYRCVRGGSWYTPDYYLQVKNRSTALPLSKDPDLGFRLVRMAQ